MKIKNPINKAPIPKQALKSKVKRKVLTIGHKDFLNNQLDKEKKSLKVKGVFCISEKKFTISTIFIIYYFSIKKTT